MDKASLAALRGTAINSVNTALDTLADVATTDAGKVTDAAEALRIYRLNPRDEVKGLKLLEALSALLDALATDIPAHVADLETQIEALENPA